MHELPMSPEIGIPAEARAPDPATMAALRFSPSDTSTSVARRVMKGNLLESGTIVFKASSTINAKVREVVRNIQSIMFGMG